ncbi:MAG: damage-inducible protein DinB [Acidobacteria bacterium]|nr:MAG: damage-inducible protein DinB [Acidobacteriota bacterium]
MLDALLDSWDRNNTILVNLLGAIPDDALDLTAVDDSPSIAALFMHMHYVRLVFVLEDAPDLAQPVPDGEWQHERDRARMTGLLNDSAKAVRDAVKNRIETGRQMELHYDHPILMLQHLIWHEGYHHGQIKIALKRAGRPIDNRLIGPLTWRVWMNKGPR